MLLDQVILLAAHTARSQAYLQAMLAADLQPAQVILLGTPPAQSADEVAARLSDRWNDILLPDLSVPLQASCASAGIPVQCFERDDANADEVAMAIRYAKARIVIYSGRGGQLVAPNMLELGPKFLHMHSGWLPDYRGSTTLYYALLNGELPAVTALFLDQKIDTGPLLARAHYSRPEAGMDIDRLYDAAIRADMLVRVLRSHVDSGVLPALEPQSPDAGCNHYVIHPVLKHLAILSLQGGGNDLAA